MKFFTVATLVDITATGVTRNQPDKELERNQQRNWETVLQCIGIRAQPQLIEGPIYKEFEVDESTVFGELYFGVQKVWLFSFGVDFEDAWTINHDEVAGLEKDFAQVPIICGLEETARFMLPIFYPYGALKNIHFMTGRLSLNIV